MAKLAGNLRTIFVSVDVNERRQRSKVCGEMGNILWGLHRQCVHLRGLAFADDFVAFVELIGFSKSFLEVVVCFVHKIPREVVFELVVDKDRGCVFCDDSP